MWMMIQQESSNSMNFIESHSVNLCMDVCVDLQMRGGRIRL